jgi:hypothetical protein
MTFYGGIFRHFLGEQSEPPYIPLSKSIMWNGGGVGEPLGSPSGTEGVWGNLKVSPIFYSIVYNYISNSIPIQKI